MSAWHPASVKPQQSSPRHENCTVGQKSPQYTGWLKCRGQGLQGAVFSIPGLSRFGPCRSNWTLVSTGWGFLGQVLLTLRPLGGRWLLAALGRGAAGRSSWMQGTQGMGQYLALLFRGPWKPGPCSWVLSTEAIVISPSALKRGQNGFRSLLALLTNCGAAMAENACFLAQGLNSSPE